MRFHKSRKQRTEKYGKKFDNGDELKRYEYLMLRYRAGEITEPEVHPEFPVVINGVYCWTYVADFRYRLVIPGGRMALGCEMIEDCKGTYNKKKHQTRKGVVVREWKVRAPILEPEYIIKKKIVEALYEIKIEEIWNP
jgi:hypothetical protein